MFITFEGPDGSGKSTAIAKLSKHLTSKGIKFVLTREPGSENSRASKAIRKILIDPKNNIPDLSEALLFAADRKMHLESLILPALEKGTLVLSDRYVDSSLAYQGAGRGLGIERVKQINEIATEGVYPDLTIFFDIKPSDSEKRVDARAEKDRMELNKKSFHQKVYDGYLELIDMFPERFVVVDANQSINDVFEDVKKIVMARLEK